MKRYILFCANLILACSQNLFSQDYSTASIPDSLKTNAYSVVRDFTRIYELKSVNSGIVKIKRVVTVLTKEGDNHADLSINYDENSTINIKEIVIYDSEGKKAKSVKQSEIQDVPAYGSSELYSENRVKYYDPDFPKYPYTVSYEYELKLNNIISYGVWRPINDYNISLQHSRFTFICPPDVKINIKQINMPENKTEAANNENTKIWEVNSLKAIESEPMEISLAERIPGVYVMPSKLIYENYEGNAGSWEAFGEWIYSLYKGRDQLSDVEKIKIDQLISGIPDTLERIKVLYKYMQDRTRYVAVTLGIGGFQPFDTKTVFETGYGDCKALTNYMYSLLKYTGIESFPALVAAGSYKIKVFTDFPNFLQFNHVILCVPFRKDTIWLECTDQKIPFGFLGDFTDDREVLLFNKDGGKFAHTTSYKVYDNIRTCSSEIELDSTGTALFDSRTVMRGLQYDNMIELIASNYDEQRKWLYSNSKLPSLRINNFSITENKSSIPSVNIIESSVSKNFCSFSGNYMILSLNLINAQRPLQKMLNKRHSEVLINRSFIDFDTLIYKIPKKFKYESLPVGSKFSSKFGSYVWSVSGTDGRIVYTRKLEIIEGRYAPSDYKELYDFILSVSKADNTKVLLTRIM